MRALSISFAVLLAAQVARAEEAQRSTKVPTFSVEQLVVDGHVRALEEVDLDGDGKLDLVAAVVKGEQEKAVRSLAIFWNRGGSFSNKPDLVLPLDADVCAYDLANIDDKPGAELMVITSIGVRAHSFSGRVLGPNIDLISQPTLFIRAPREELVRFRLAQPLGPNRAPVLLVPGLGTLTLYRREGPVFVKRGQLEVEMETTIESGRRGDRERMQQGVESFAVNARFPSIEVADLDADGRLDLLLARNEHVEGYLQAADGSFPSKPSFAQTLLVRAKKGADGDEDDGDGKNASSQMRVLDVDGDGRADIVLTTTTTAGISSATTAINLFLGAPGGFHEKPDQVIRNEGASFIGPQLGDLTGGGHLDLLVPSFKLGIFSIIRILTSKSIKVNFLLFPFGADRRFADKPSASRELTFKIDLAGREDLQAIDMYGDYLGDKRLDLAFGTDENELSLYGAGDKGTLFAEDPMAKVSVRAYGDVDSVDLDGQGRSDLVLHYPNSHGHEGEIAVVHNRFEGTSAVPLTAQRPPLGIERVR